MKSLRSTLVFAVLVNSAVLISAVSAIFIIAPPKESEAMRQNLLNKYSVSALTNSNIQTLRADMQHLTGILASDIKLGAYVAERGF